MRYVFLALGLFLVLVAPARAAENILNIQAVTSESGITAWLVEDSSVPVLSLQFAFLNAGTKQDPPAKQGMVRLVSNMLDEGAGELDSQAFQKELRDLSIDLSYQATRDHLRGSLKTLTENRARAFELLKLSLTAPRFDAEPFTRMVKANQSRIKTSLSDPDWIAARLMNDRAFEGHPYAQNSGGTLSTLDAVEIADLQRFYADNLGRNNLVVAASGDISAQELRSALDDIFGGLPNVSPAPHDDLQITHQGQSYVYDQNIPQTIIEIMQPGIARTHPQYQDAVVMNFILGSSGFGSRLTEEIREKRGLTYGIYSSLQTLDHVQGLGVSTSTRNENVPEMLSLIEQEFIKLAQEPVSAQEITDAQSYLIGSLPLSLTSTSAIAGLMLSLQEDGLPIDYLDQRQEKIEAVTPQKINDIAASLLNPENWVTIMVGKPDMQDNAIRIETIPNAE